MKRLLCLISGMNAGGAETFLMKIYRNIDRTKYQFDFCINIPEKCFYEDEIVGLGGKIFRIPTKSESPKEFKKKLSEIIKSGNYKYVLRITSNAMGFWDLKIAKKAGAEVCCARSSNSSDGAGLKLKVAHMLGRILYSKYVDVAFAPSDLAAVYTFGKKKYKNGNTLILHNAVDMNFFHYDECSRSKIRKELGIAADVKVIGHVGRFTEQKNHMFLLDIFRCMKENNDNVVLLLVGEGPLRDQVEQKAIELGIQDYILYTGVRSDMPELLSAMDVFVFPSFYEGMPNTVIESQATGLPCVIADTITREANITGLVDYLSLSETAECWAQTAMEKTDKERIDTKHMFKENKYDIDSVTEQFVDMIFN